MGEEIQVDLPVRTEERYIVANPGLFLARLSPLLERIKFSDKEFVQTIYLNNNEHVVPFGLSIKARRYLLNFPDSLSLDEGMYFLDLKRAEGDTKQKKRLEATLQGACSIANETYHFPGMPLRPYTAVQYYRNHYVPKNMRGIRITIDNNLRYFFFPPGQAEAIEIGREEGTRIEIKLENVTRILRY